MLKEQVLATNISARNIAQDGKVLLEMLPQTTQLKNSIYLFHQLVWRPIVNSFTVYSMPMFSLEHTQITKLWLSKAREFRKGRSDF